MSKHSAHKLPRIDHNALSAGQRARLARILDAAEAAFIANGLAGTTMEGIAREASVAKATVYSYFPSKDEAFRQVAERLAKRIERAALPWLEVPQDQDLTRKQAQRRIADALVEKQRIVFDVVRRSPHAQELFQAKGQLVAERFEKLDGLLIEGAALLLRRAAIQFPLDQDDDVWCHGPAQLATLCLRGAFGVANTCTNWERMEVDLRCFVEQFLS